MWFLMSSALAWTIVGPERGHILDVDVGVDEVLVTTRVGVMRSSKRDFKWSRDSRFPPDTKRIATWSGGAWGAPPTQLWEINGDGKRLVQSNPRSVITDLDARADGVVFVGWRGQTRGLWRVEPSGEAKLVIPNIEPWVILSEGRNIWVATIQHGLWASEEGQPFVQMTAGSITTVERVGGEIWIALSTGELFYVHTQEQVTKIESGFASHIAELDSNSALLTVVSPNRQAHPFQVLEDGELTPITKMQVDNDSGFIGPTGSWSLNDGTALVGTFRRGPLKWDGELSTIRSGFYATVSGGAAVDSQGRVAMAFMGTGVYLYDSGSIVPHPTEGPVTDSVFVSSLMGQVVVVDFEGINLLETDGSWSQISGVPDQRQRIGNILQQVGKSTDTAWWAIDHNQRLWSRVEAGEWERCQLTGAIRLDGDGADLIVVTKRGFVRPGCHQVEPIEVPSMDTINSRAWGDWIATSEFLYFKEQLILDLPEAKIDALIADGPEAVLISARHEPIIRCTIEACEEVAPAIAEPVLAMGRLITGELWVLEQKGTLLVDDETKNVPDAWYDFTERRVQFSSFVQLYVNPWLRPKTEKPFEFLHSPKSSIFEYLIGALLLIGGLLTWKFGRRRIG